MNNQICCFTGHRQLPANEIPQIQKRLEEEIINLFNQGVTTFLAGGALGFDTMAALTVLTFRREIPKMKLILILPCKDQSKSWHENDQKSYNQIRNQADEVVYISEHYHPGCMQLRNRYLVNHSDICVCFLKELSGGTAHTVKYARQKERSIINLAPYCSEPSS